MRNILANIFISDLYISDAGLITVTNVRVTDDLKIAKIYISFLENKIPIDDLIKTIVSKRNVIRYHIGIELKLKYVPELRFYYDDTMVYAENIDNLLNKIHNND